MPVRPRPPAILSQGCDLSCGMATQFGGGGDGGWPSDFGPSRWAMANSTSDGNRTRQLCF